MAVTKKKPEGIATIDVELVVIRTGDGTNGTEYAIDTAGQIQVKPQTEEEDAIRLVKLGRLLAQKLATTTITGHQITLTDNVFYPEVAKVLQGGTFSGEGASMTYEPPAAGSNEKGEVFELDCYSAQYDASGQIVNYEKITYPNCQGTPFGLSSEDNVFRLPEYVINSAPKAGQAPYKISYVNELPSFADADMLSVQSVSANSVPSNMASVGTTVVTKK